MVAVYQRCNPRMVVEVDRLLDKYAGREAALYNAVVAKYSSWRGRLARLYKRCNPKKLEKVDYLMHKYRGQEAALCDAVKRKYELPPGLETDGLLPVGVFDRMKDAERRRFARMESEGRVVKYGSSSSQAPRARKQLKRASYQRLRACLHRASRGRPEPVRLPGGTGHRSLWGHECQLGVPAPS